MLEILPQERTGPQPLSFTQEGFWELGQSLPEEPIRNLTGIFRLRGPFDGAAFSRALEEIAQRHDILRASFHPGTDGPVARIAQQAQAPLTHLDVSALPAAEREAAALAHLAPRRIVPFDHTRPPLFHAFVVRLDEELHLVMLLIDHIVFDGWSYGVFVRELTTLYNAFAQGQATPLAPPQVQYFDFARWQRARLGAGHLDELWDYWRAQLAGNQPDIHLPSDHPREEPQPYTLGMHLFEVSAPLAAQLRAFSRSAGVSLFMTLLAGLQAFLFRRTGCGKRQSTFERPIANVMSTGPCETAGSAAYHRGDSRMRRGGGCVFRQPTGAVSFDQRGGAPALRIRPSVLHHEHGLFRNRRIDREH